MSQQPVKINILQNVAWISLNRPESHNAADETLLVALHNALETTATNVDVRVVVLTGTGKSFCSGADLKAGIGPDMDFKAHLEHTFNPVIRIMRNMNKPIITAVNGVAAGAGASIALAGDIRIWSTAASFLEAFSKIALIPDAGSTWFLPRLVGYHKAFDLCARATRVLPDEGLRLGLCEHVFAAETFETEVQAFAEQLALGPSHAIALTKRALNASLNNSLETQLDLEGDLQNLAGRHPDFVEGVTAFLEKRQAKFK